MIMKKSDDKNKKHFFLKKRVDLEIEIDEAEDKSGIREVVVEKNNGFNTVEVIIIIFVSIFFGVVVGCVLSSSKTFGMEVSKEAEEIITTYNSIVDNYYDEIDEKELLDSAVSGMISVLDDPYSVFMDDNNTANFTQTIDGSFVGIGVMVEWSSDGFCITQILDDSPAEKAKLMVGDFIIKINGKDIKKFSLTEVSNMLKGKVGTKMSLTIDRNGKQKDIDVKLEIVEIESVYSKEFDENIGYISIENFASNTSQQFIDALSKLEDKGIKSLIIDLRDNPGGRLGQVNDILDLFFDKKTILYQIETKGKKERVYAKKADKRNYPIAILVNYGSASASEIMAVSFQENYDNVIVVGGVTYGKGTIQKAVELSSGSSLKYTTQKWLTPSGKWINEKGVIPDEIVDQSEDYNSNPTDTKDAQLQKAIELLKK